jgi:hypothetical protein
MLLHNAFNHVQHTAYCHTQHFKIHIFSYTVTCYAQRPLFQCGKCLNFKIGMKFVIRSVGLLRKMYPLQVNRYEHVKIIGVDLNFSSTRYVSRTNFGNGWNAFSTGMGLGPTVQ